MSTHHFERLEYVASKRLPCPACGVKVKRQTTLSATVNPFNRHPDGTMKSRKEVGDELWEKRKQYLATPELCVKCRMAK